MIKTIFFDFGGVIIKTPDYAWVNRWKGILGIEDQLDLLELLENPHESHLMHEICLGNIPEDHVWAIMAEKWHIKPAWIGYLRRQVSSRRHLNQNMVKFMAKLHEKYQTAILSNAGDQTRRLMVGTHQLDRYVDDIIISAEEGVIKPDHRLFAIAMERMEITPENSLLLDDNLANVFAAREFGMHAVQFINNHQARSMVGSYLDGKG